MQQGYGVQEFQQFLVDGCSLFSISHEVNNNSQSKQQHQQQPQQQQLRLQQHLLPTQQFFHQHHHHHHHHHQFQAALQQQHQHHQHNSPSRIVHLLGNFKQAVVTESGSREPLTDEDAIEDTTATAIRGPVWKFADLGYNNRSNKRCKDKFETLSNKLFKKGDEGNEVPHQEEEGKNNNSSTSYRLFGELEAIYGGGSNKVASVGPEMQTGSGSALTGDNLPPPAAMQFASGIPETSDPRIDLGSETSAEAEASLKKIQKKTRKRKRKQLKSIAVFFQSLVRQLMDHQEGLHRKFLEIMERRDQEKIDREEAWRRQEANIFKRENAIRVQEQALTSIREASIVSFLEKITGETINPPIRPSFQAEQEETHQVKQLEKPIETSETQNTNNTRRWPRAEVHALIRVRYGLESSFQEPGLKGPLWDEVSSTMACMGYHRSAKRCKEKWENINKYFRKTKGSAKKRSQQSKTCPYFHQLDLLYSKGLNSSLSSSLKIARKDQPANSVPGISRPDDNSELLDAIVPTDHGKRPKSSLDFVEDQLEMRRGIKINELGSLKLGFNTNDNYEASHSKAHGGKTMEDDEDDDEEDVEEEEVEEEDVDEDEEEGILHEEEDEDEHSAGREREKEENEEQVQCSSTSTFLDLVHKLTANAAVAVGDGNHSDFPIVHSDLAPPYTAG